MANEITVTMKVGYERDDVSGELNPGANINFDTIGNEFCKGVQVVDDSEGALNLCGVSLSAGNGALLVGMHRGGGISPETPGYIDIAESSGETPMVRVKAFEPVFMRFRPGAVPTLVSDDEDIVFEYMLIGN